MDELPESVETIGNSLVEAGIGANERIDRLVGTRAKAITDLFRRVRELQAQIDKMPKGNFAHTDEVVERGWSEPMVSEEPKAPYPQVNETAVALQKDAMYLEYLAETYFKHRAFLKDIAARIRKHTGGDS
jgi:hypothetical protein